jgi:hypothetical protein
VSTLSEQLLLIILWGFIATAALSVVMFGSQRLGYSRLSLPFLIGTMFTAERSGAMAAGFVLYLLGGWLFAFVYSFMFASIGRAGALLGALLGAVHGLALLMILLTVLPYLHPRMATPHEGPDVRRMLEPPGFLGLNYGYRTPLSTVLAHAVYGAILGAQLPFR